MEKEVSKVSKAEKAKISNLFNLAAEAFGYDPNDALHELKVQSLKEQGVTEESRPLLQKMVYLQKEKADLQKRKEGINGEKQNEKNQASFENKSNPH